MAALKRLLVIVALALCAGQTLAALPTSPAASPSSYSADGLYNLGNSYARAGEWGLAALNYERAGLLAPNDPDIHANLAYVRAAAHVPMAPQRGYARLVLTASPSLAAWLGAAGIVLIGVGLVIGRMTRRRRWLCRAAIALGVVQLSLMASNALLQWPHMQEAIVLIDQTAAHTAPASMADTVFVLRETQSVRLMGEYGTFVLVRTPAGLSGWVSRANVSAVVPTGGRGR